jgi:ADP-heptose:LPS heptosyltransferase
VAGHFNPPSEWQWPALSRREGLKILVIKLRALGDVLLSTVVLPNLKKAFPNARIDFYTEHPAQQLLEGRGELNRIYSFRKGRDSILRSFLDLRREKYDIVFDLFCNPRSAQLARATGAPIRVGYPFRGRAWAYTVHVKSRSDTVHNTEFNLDALRALGIPVQPSYPVMPLDPEDVGRMRAWIDSLPPHRGPVVAFNAGGTWPTKRWGLDKFAALADLLVERHGAACVMLWGPGEEDDARAVISMMKHKAHLAPPTTLRELAALASCCPSVISNDTGPMHLSAAAGIPVLGIFGPTNPFLQGPCNPVSRWVREESVDCLACNLTSCTIGTICMSRLMPLKVLDAWERMGGWVYK